TPTLMGDDIFDGLSLYRWSGLSTRTRQRLHRIGKLTEDRGQGSHDDLEIQREGNITRVKYIHLDHLAKCCSVLAVHLPKSGQTWQRITARSLFGRITFEFQNRARSWSDQPHFSLQHIEDLRQFVEAGCSQKLPANDETRIPRGVEFDHRTVATNQMFQVRLVHVSFCVYFHGAEFYKHETASLESDARLTVKDWAW